MVFNAVLFFAVLFITALFLYLAYTFKRDVNKAVSYKGKYYIEVSTDFAGESLSIYVNDSLLMDGTMPDTLVSLDVNRFAEEHALLIVDKQTDIVTPFNLSKEGGKVIIKKEGSKIMMEEMPSRF